MYSVGSKLVIGLNNTVFYNQVNIVWVQYNMYLTHEGTFQ